MRAKLVLIAILASAAPLGAQSTWHVDLSAVPPGDGSPSSPFVSIQQALDAPTTLDGDTLLVAPGSYAESIDFAGRQLVVRSSAGPLVTQLLPGSASDPVVVRMGADGCCPKPTLEGFTIRRASPTPGQHGVEIAPPREARLVRCIITGHGIGVANHYDAFLEECTITGNLVGIGASTTSGHFLSSTICKGNALDVQIGGFGNFTARYSNVGGLLEHCDLPGECVGSIDQDPRFWGAAAGDFRLRPDSPCIDAGDPASPLDPDGSRLDMGALTYDPAWAPGTSTSCFGAALLCPCGNGGSGLGGCDNFQATGGFVLAISDFAPDGAGGGSAHFIGTGYPPAGTPGSTLIRSPALEASPIVFGDGLRCVAATGLVRVGATVASGGTSLHAIHHGAGAGTFHYQTWVRSNPASFCNPEAFNLSNVVTVAW